MVRKNIDINQKPTKEQAAMLKSAALLPIPSDAEYPEFTDKELAQFKSVSRANAEARHKQTVTLRLSPQATKNAKALGKGYTSVLSRILEQALSDPNTIRRYL